MSQSEKYAAALAHTARDALRPRVFRVEPDQFDDGIAVFPPMGRQPLGIATNPCDSSQFIYADYWAPGTS